MDRQYAISLDVGEKRIGVAIAHRANGFPAPLTTLVNDDGVINHLRKICHKNDIGEIVVGLPRGLDGQDTAQTRYCQLFADSVSRELGLPVYLIDEAVTSAKAEAELAARGARFSKEDIDALAATYILEDFIRNKQYEG
jgi:putative Holliday junction resolvase